LVDLLLSAAAELLVLYSDFIRIGLLGQLPLLLAFALLLSLRHDELIGTDSFVDEVAMQQNQVDQQKHEDGVDSSRKPGDDKPGEETSRCELQGQN
jgi:hypothetical protein